MVKLNRNWERKEMMQREQVLSLKTTCFVITYSVALYSGGKEARKNIEIKCKNVTAISF